MLISNNKNIYKKVYKLFLKYKVASISFIAIVAMVYPLYFYINDYNVKYLKIDLNYTMLLRENKAQADNFEITNYAAKIQNEIEYNIENLKNETSVTCETKEFLTNCLFKINNWIPKKNYLLEKTLKNSIGMITDDLRSKIEQRIEIIDLNINNQKIVKNKIDQKKIEVIDIDNFYREIDFEIESNRYITEKIEKKIFLNFFLYDLDNLNKKFNDLISIEFMSNKINPLEHYNLRNHIFTIILGLSFLFFIFLIIKI